MSECSEGRRTCGNLLKNRKTFKTSQRQTDRSMRTFNGTDQSSGEHKSRLNEVHLGHVYM